MKKYFLCLLVLFSPNAFALNHKGLALIEIRNSQTILELTQIVSITDEKVVFVNLDDWGNESFQVIFNGKVMRLVADGTDMQIAHSPLKRALRLPLTQEEFLSIVRFVKPENFSASEDEQGIVWKKPKYKKLKILFQKFGTIAKTNLPSDIQIQYKKNSFHLKWFNTNTKSTNTH